MSSFELGTWAAISINRKIHAGENCVRARIEKVFRTSGPETLGAAMRRLLALFAVPVRTPPL